MLPLPPVLCNHIFHLCDSTSNYRFISVQFNISPVPVTTSLSSHLHIFFQCPFFRSLVILLLVCLYNLQFEIMTSHLNVIYIFQTSFLEADFHLFVSGGVACCIDVMSLQAKPLYMYSPPTLLFTPC